jgi:transcription elongation factor Elf1
MTVASQTEITVEHVEINTLRPDPANPRRISDAELEAFCHAWARNLLEHVDGALYVCMSTREWPTVSRVLEEFGAHWSDNIIWTKDRFVLGRADYQRQYEPLWYGWREGAGHHWCGDRDQGDVWTIERPTELELHPTMKPLALVARYKGQTYSAEVVQTEDGLRYRLEDGREFKSPSSAGSAVMGGVACNGWRSWSLEGQVPARKEPKAKARTKGKTKAEGKARRFACPRCGLTYPTAERAANCPCDKEEAQEPPAEAAIGCGECAETFATLAEASEHFATAHAAAEEPTE